VASATDDTEGKRWQGHEQKVEEAIGGVGEQHGSGMEVVEDGTALDSVRYAQLVGRRSQRLGAGVFWVLTFARCGLR
jgi:hypothetical protein